MSAPAARGAALGLTGLAAGAFAYVALSTRDLRDPTMCRNARRLAVNAALCFLWPALALLILPPDVLGGQALSIAGAIVIGCMCLEVTSVASYIGRLDAYSLGDSKLERSTQISTAAFAAGTFLLSNRGGAIPPCVARLVFLALLLCLLSSVPSISARRGRGGSTSWEAVQRGAVSFAAGFMALAIASCIDHNLT